MGEIKLPLLGKVTKPLPTNSVTYWGLKEGELVERTFNRGKKKENFIFTSICVTSVCSNLYGGRKNEGERHSFLSKKE